MLAARVDMHVPLDDPATLFLHWNGSAYEPFEMETLPVGRPNPLTDVRLRDEPSRSRSPSDGSGRTAGTAGALESPRFRAVSEDRAAGARTLPRSGR